MQRRNAKRGGGQRKKPGRDRARNGAAKPPAPRATQLQAPNGGQWCVAHDGHLFYVVGNAVALSIPRPSAVALVDVARRYGTVPFASLQAFVEKLDKAGV